MKVSLFADDTVIHVNGNASQFNYVFEILNYFGNKSRREIILGESNAFCVESSREKNNKSFLNCGLSWPDTSIKYLVVNIPISKFDELLLFEENFTNIIDDMQSILNLWSVRGLTLQGKITALKTLVISKIIYKASHFPTHLPEAFVKQLDKLMFKFILGFNWEKISRSKLCCNIEDGRARMIDVIIFLTLKLR